MSGQAVTMRGTGDGWARLDGRDNALNAIRLALALLVVFGHSYVLGYGTTPPLPGIHDRAVDGFFVVSGFLIAASRARMPIGPFAWRRALRIYPGLWVCLVVTALVIAPATAALTGEQWTLTDGASYIVANATALSPQWNIGGTLASLPYPTAWNGSLWTLTYELGCYAGVAVIFTATKRRVEVVGGVLVACAALTVLNPPAMLVPAVRLAGFFAAGSLIYLLRDRLPCTARLAVVAGAAAVAFYLLGERAFVALAPLPLAYSLLFLGATLRCRVGSRNDISFGVYVYAFPLQQMLVAAGAAALPVSAFVALCVAATTALAWPSWLLVERPTLRLARRQPTRASRYDTDAELTVAADAGHVTLQPRKWLATFGPGW